MQSVNILKAVLLKIYIGEIKIINDLIKNIWIQEARHCKNERKKA